MNTPLLFFESSRKFLASFCAIFILLTSLPAAPVFAQNGQSANLKDSSKSAEASLRKRSARQVPIVSKVVFSSAPNDVEIQTARIFSEPLIPLNAGTSSSAENVLLSQKLAAFKEKKNLEDLSDLEQFIAAFPNSKWNAALKLSMGTLSKETGFTTNAVSYFRSAWEHSKDETGRQQRNLANKAFTQYLMMLTRLGRVEELQVQIDHAKNRAFHGAEEAHLDIAKSALACFKSQPEISFKCGPSALNSILNRSKKLPGKNSILSEYHSSKKGTSLAELKVLAAKVGMKYQAAKRTPGAAFIVPSLMHLRTEHFSAITNKLNDKFQVEDPTFDYAGNSWISAMALEAESDGYFLVPEGSLPTGWHSVSQQEAASVWGKGGSQGQNPPNPNQPKSCTTKSCKKCPGMPIASAYTMQASLNLQDVPVSYSAPIGPNMDFLLNYNQGEQGQPANFSFSNVGPNWSLNWISYLTLDASRNVTVMVRGGGLEYYPFVQPNNLNNPYPPNLYSQSVITVDLANTTYTRTHPDGSAEIFGYGDGTGRFFMTEVRDAQGVAAKITYEAGNTYRISEIIDAIGQASELIYVSDVIGNPDYYKVKQIKVLADASQPRLATLTYDFESDSISSITDAVGLRSDFTYEALTSFVNLMTTPYGSTSFKAYGADYPTETMRGLRTQLADGSATVIENWMRHTITTNFWDREQLALYPNEPGNINPTHCTRTKFMFSYIATDEAAIPQWVESPLTSRITYAYEGEVPDVGGNRVGINNKPISVSRLVENGSGPLVAQTSQYIYNSLGKTTQSTDPIGRKFEYKYAANNIDLLEVRQTKNGANDLIGKWIYDDKHRVTQYTDGSGQKTNYVYNTDEQLISTTDAAGNTTTMSYDINKRLQEIDGPMPGNSDKTIFTWNVYGQIQTITDSVGYQLSFEYDALDRPITTTYPDVSTEKTVYDKLDAVLMKDRNDRWSSRAYDSLDQLVTETDPLGRKIKYTWCDCGSLATLTDGNLNTTSWHHDLEGRVIQKVYADETHVDYAYEPNSGRLKTRTDALNQITTYSYNLDNTLSNVGYTNETNPTSDVSMTYDQNYQRTATVQNGWGTNSYTYFPYITDPLKAANFWISGKPTIGDIVNVTVSSSSLAGGKQNVQYIVSAGDTSATALAGHVVSAINANSALNTANIKASNSMSLVSISAPPIAAVSSVITSTNGIVTETIGGTITAGNKVSLTTKDAALPGGQKMVDYTIVVGDSLTSIATGLKNAINADSNYQTAGITATSSAAIVSITSTSSNATTYYESINAGGTATITHRGGPGETATAGGGGRLQTAANDVIANSTISYSYDSLGRTLNRAIDGASNSIYWGYDEMSRVTTEANLLGTFGYNYVDNTSGSSKGVTRLASINYPNNQVTNFDWYNNNGDERLKQIQNLGPNGNILSQFNYRYNPAGEITQWPQIQNGLSRFQQLGYDLAGQLTTSQISSTTPSNKYLNQDYYVYDPGANRTGNQTTQAQNIVIGGTKTTGDVLTVTVKDSGLSGGQQVVNYTVLGGDTPTTIAANLAAAITLDLNLQTLGVYATSASTTITVKSVSPNITTYSSSTSGGATETISIGTTQNFVENATIALKPGQSITTGDVLKILIRDPALTTNNPQEIAYTVAGGNTLTNIATGLKNAINANSYLPGIGVSATSAGATVTIKSTSANPTIYRNLSSDSIKESIDLNVCPNGMETIGLGGTVTTGDHIYLTVLDAGLSGGYKLVKYQVAAGNSLTAIATGLKDAVNNATELQAIGVTATSSGPLVSVTSNSPNVTTYRGNTGDPSSSPDPNPNTTASEIVKLGLPPNGTQTAVIGGTKTTGNVLTITVYDAGLAGGSKAINYSVQGGDTLATMTSGLASAITADSALVAIGVSATAVSNVINIKSTSQNATTYTSSLSGGATATITLAKTIGAQLSAYNNVNELTSIAAGGPVRFQASTNKALKTASANSNPATLVTTKNFVRDESLSSGASAISVAATDGANNTKINTSQVNVNPVSTQNLTYDANGNMTSDGTNTYKWDAVNRLIEIDYPGSGNKSEFVYDGFGRNTIIIETQSGVITSTKQFVWASGMRLECRDGSANPLQQYMACGQCNGLSNVFYTRDLLESVRELVDSVGTIIAQYEFDPFGRKRKILGSSDSEFQYAGYYQHEASNLYLTTYRAYASRFGRWLNRDPIAEAGGLNVFAYASNSPIIAHDPSGLDESMNVKDFADYIGTTPDKLKYGCRDVVNHYLGFDSGTIPEQAVNSGNTQCFKGRNGYGIVSDPDRIKCPCEADKRVVWGKQSEDWGPNGPPKSDPFSPNLDTTARGGQYDYMVIDPAKGGILDMNWGSGGKAPQMGNVRQCPPNGYPPKFVEIWCVTCIKKK